MIQYLFFNDWSDCKVEREGCVDFGKTAGAPVSIQVKADSDLDEVAGLHRQSRGDRYREGKFISTWW